MTYNDEELIQITESLKQEWTEYDQDMLVAIDCLTKQGRHLEEEHLNWLKSLKGKIEREDTKQCTENDKVVDYILYIMNQLKGSTMYAEDDIAEKCVNWLKSLKSMNYPQLKQKWLDKACKWLGGNACFYIRNIDSSFYYDTAKCLVDFRKSMED